MTHYRKKAQNYTLKKTMYDTISLQIIVILLTSVFTGFYSYEPANVCRASAALASRV